jgi:hypothetical protein
MQTKLDALLIANERLDEKQLLGLERHPDSMIKDVQTEVHGAGPEDVDEGGDRNSDPDRSVCPRVPADRLRT